MRTMDNNFVPKRCSSRIYPEIINVDCYLYWLALETMYHGQMAVFVYRECGSAKNQIALRDAEVIVR